MDRLVIDYLKNRGKSSMDEYEFMNKFKDFMRYKRNSMRHGEEQSYYPMENRMEDFYMKRHGKPEDFIDKYDFDERLFDKFNRYNMGEDDMYHMMKYMRESMPNEHFSDSEAKYIVSEMYHIENGRKHSGEKFDMHKAKEVCERYRGILPSTASVYDVYVAINAQYHDYSELFKKWFGDNVDQKIIESAIVFWFKDVDAKSENKVLNYFKGY